MVAKESTAGKRGDAGDEEKIWREEYGESVLVPAVYWNESRKKKGRKDITMAEVAKHNTRADAWICVEGRAYDVTKYVESHPGGWLPISNLAGKDVTDAFANYHPATVYEKLLPNFYIGDICDYKVSEFVQEHRDVRQELLRRGLFKTDMSYYAKLCVWYATLFTGALYFTILRPSVWEHMLGAVLMAAFWQQIAFFGHDIGHNGVSHVRKNDLWWGIVIGNTTGGISLGWWKRSHNVHHVVCNSIENDPDIQHMPIFAVSPDMFGKFWSTYHEKIVVTDDIARLLVSVQHYLYYPVMCVARFNLYVQSYLLLFSREKVDHKALEIGTLAIFTTWFTAMVCLCLGSWQERVAYLLLSHGIAGLLHVQITLSHFAEDTYHGNAYNDDTDEWFRMQCKTTLNVDCPEYMDWFHGGLQFQIEHHLYPRLPRHNLRECRKLVKQLCKKHDVEYKELSFVDGNKRVFRCLKAAAYEARNLTKGDAGFWHSPIIEGLNAAG
jgi:delta8-fatty-acid desaturase